MGVWNSHTSVGNILGSLIAAYWVSTCWGLSFVVPGVIVALMGVVCFLFLIERECFSGIQPWRAPVPQAVSVLRELPPRTLGGNSLQRAYPVRITESQRLEKPSKVINPTLANTHLVCSPEH